MKSKTTVFYNDTDLGDIDLKRELMFEEYAEEEGWESVDDIPDSVVFHEIDEDNRIEWEDFTYELERILKDGEYILTGTCGRWDGRAEGGNFIHNIHDFYKCIGHLDKIKFYDENGHFYIYGYHHDGSDFYELKKLTRKGYEYASNNYFAHDRQVHRTITSCNLYSALPRIAERLYG